MTPPEQDHGAEGSFGDTTIHGAVHCGRCGYSLRTLPYVYKCPECGQEYNARSLKMKGIFLADQADWPMGILFLLACVVAAAVLFYGAFSPPDIWRLLGGVILAVFCVVDTPRQWKALRRYLAARAIIRRIDRDES